MWKIICLETFLLFHLVFSEQKTRIKRSSSEGEPFERGHVQRRFKRETARFDDDKWSDMWYINEQSTKGVMMNVEAAWNEGYTGKGVTVVVVDDGLEWHHPEIIDSYDPKVSTDLNGDDSDPSPRYDEKETNKQGTNLAGIIVSKPNNLYCGVGIAHGAKIGGIRVLDGNVFDRDESQALSFQRDSVDIYNAGWGPNDDGKTVDGPGSLARTSLEEGAKNGRNGKGSIFVWASGTGGKSMDNCNCDGYSSSIYTIAVGSAKFDGSFPWFAEQCAASLAVTFSSGSRNDPALVTSTLYGKCKDGYTGGTSGSAAIASGIIGLTLEANPQLTWRDVQHVIVRTARPAGFLKADDWTLNSAGLKFSRYFAFGLMDAGAMVRMAKTWKTVPDQISCQAVADQPLSDPQINGKSQKTFSIDASLCNEIRYLENVQLKINFSSVTKRGDISLSLTSPSETKSIILTERPLDDDSTDFSGFLTWPMSSVHFWGESVKAGDSSDWKLTVNNGGENSVTLDEWSLIFHGTSTNPLSG